MTKTKTANRIAVETVVGTRYLRPEQRWWEGEGRGYTREFIPTGETQTCKTCDEDLDLQAFPTFTVPRKDGRTRGDECRECRDARREAARKAAERSARARKAAATRAARKAVAA